MVYPLCPRSLQLIPSHELPSNVIQEFHVALTFFQAFIGSKYIRLDCIHMNTECPCFRHFLQFLLQRLLCPSNSKAEGVISLSCNFLSGWAYNKKGRCKRELRHCYIMPLVCWLCNFHWIPCMCKWHVSGLVPSPPSLLLFQILLLYYSHGHFMAAGVYKVHRIIHWPASWRKVYDVGLSP